MYIVEARISNIRGFTKDAVNLSFQRPDGRFAGWTVVAGRNGSGKSTFLRVLCLGSVGPLVSRTLVETFEGWINEGSQRGTVRLTLERSGDDRFVEPGRAPAHFPVELEWTRQSGPEPKLGASLTPT